MQLCIRNLVQSTPVTFEPVSLLSQVQFIPLFASSSYWGSRGQEYAGKKPGVCRQKEGGWGGRGV